MDTTTAVLLAAIVNMVTAGVVIWLKLDINKVKEQTDGINSRLEQAAKIAQAKADTATSKLADAKVEVAVVTEKLEAAKNGK